MSLSSMFAVEGEYRDWGPGKSASGVAAADAPENEDNDDADIEVNKDKVYHHSSEGDSSEGDDHTTSSEDDKQDDDNDDDDNSVDDDNDDDAKTDIEVNQDKDYEHLSAGVDHTTSSEDDKEEDGKQDDDDDADAKDADGGQKGDNEDDTDDNDSNYEEPVSKSTRNSTRLRGVTNGIGLDQLTTKFNSVVERRKHNPGTQDLFSNWKPSPSFMGLVLRWAGKRRFHYFNEIWNCTEVCATELGYSTMEYVGLRGWTISRYPGFSGDAHIEYRRLEVCLSLALGSKSGCKTKQKGLMAQFHAMIRALYRVLQEDDIDRKSPSMNLIRLHRVESFKNRITENSQSYHMAVTAVLYIFGAHIAKNDNAIQGIIHQIFGACSKKTMFNQALFDLFLFFRDDHKIKSSSDYIKQLLVHPGSIINKVHNKNQGADHGPYLQFLSDELQRMCPIDSKVHSNHLVPNCKVNNAVVRKRVANIYLNSLERKSKNKKRKNTDSLPSSNPKRIHPSSSPGPSVVAPIPAIDAISMKAIPTLCTLVAIQPSPPLDNQTLTDPAPILPNPSTARAEDRPSSDSFEIDLVERFRSVTLASQESIDRLGPPQVSVFCDVGTSHQCKKLLLCSPVELYSMQNLRSWEHQFDYGAAGSNPSMATLTVPSSASFISPPFSVLRVDHPILAKILPHVHVDVGKILLFVMQHGDQSPLRDGVGGGRRVDCGCAGQAYEQVGPGDWAPKTSVAFDIFEKIEEESERNELLASLGSIQDGIQLTLDGIQNSLGLPLLFNFPPRVEAYASKLRRLFFARSFRSEWLTIQVKCLSRGDVTLPHKDKFNCPWDSYDTTAALCIVVVDNKSTHWSMKVLVNSRAPIGSYLSKKLPIDASLFSACEGYLLGINDGYDKFSRSYVGHNPPPLLTWKTFEDFFLDDDCAWEMDEENQHHFIKLPTALSRHFWLSPAIHRLDQFRYRMHRQDLLEMVLLASYQTSWSRYWVITESMLSGGDKSKLITHPSKLYCRLAKESFKSWIGGPNPRFAPPGIDFEELYFGNNSTANLDNVLRVIKEVLAWIEKKLSKKRPCQMMTTKDNSSSSVPYFRNNADVRLASFDYRSLLNYLYCQDLLGLVWRWLTEHIL
jgi:hypothetical protein